MKLLLLTTFVATVCYRQRMLAAMNAMNGGMMGVNNNNPDINKHICLLFLGLTKFVPGVSAYAAPAPIPQVYAVPAVGGRQIMKQDNPLKTTVDTQIPAPTGTTTTTPPCDDHHDDY
ncbi:hypothetical protein ABVT39_025121 [Epinephelus coioides]